MMRRSGLQARVRSFRRIHPLKRNMPAAASLKAGALPIGLAHRVKLKNDVAHGAVVRWSDVEIDAEHETIRTRRAMEARFGASR